MHTPAPWKIELENEHGNTVYYIATEAKYYSWIAKINDNPNKSANAHLIAAAPQLLEALTELCELPNKKRPDWVWEQARAAIKKATCK